MNPVHTIRTAVDLDGGRYAMHLLWCPGCDDVHACSSRLPDTPPEETPMWDYDGNLDLPTFSPSLLVTMAEDRKCHSFVRSGRWEFLGDCWHGLAGQTVDLPPLPDWLVRE